MVGENTGIMVVRSDIVERGGPGARPRAVVAIARKLAVLLHSLWRTAEVYDPLRQAQVTEVTA